MVIEWAVSDGVFVYRVDGGPWMIRLTVSGGQSIGRTKGAVPPTRE